jgi:hypothetical protein
MEKMNKLKFTLCLLLGFIIITSCVRVRSISYEQDFRESKPNNHTIEIFDVNDIDREFKVIGEVTANGPNYRTDKILEKLRAEVREMGGDAVIDFETGSSGAGVINSGTGVYNEDARQVIKAKVIVWID